MRTLFLILFINLGWSSANAQNYITTDSVMNVYSWGDTTRAARLDERIIVTTRGTDSLLKSNEHIILFIDGLPISSCESNPNVKDRNKLIFNLNDQTSFHAIWDLFYKRGESRRQVKISVGLSGQSPLPAKENNFTLVFYNPTVLNWAFAFLLLTLTIFIVIASQSNIIKNPGSAPNPPFSLSRTQLAFWTFIIFSTFVYIWIIKDNYNSINQTALILLGISATTTIAGAVINTNQTKQDGAAALQNQSSKGFLMDILADEGGIGVHRFQNVVFNIILGIIFIVRVGKTLEMPVFDETILMLLGISAGTYTALKLNENKSTPSSTAPTTPVADAAGSESEVVFDEATVEEKNAAG